MNTIGKSCFLWAALLVASATSSVCAYDVRDYLPDGNVFELTMLSEDVWIDWDDAAEQLEITVGEVSMLASTWMNRDDTLGFQAMPPSGSGDGLVVVLGTIDLLLGGDLFLLIDIYWDTPSVEAARATHHDGATISPAQCDCSDGIGTDCVTNECNAKEACYVEQPNGPKCDWF
jgi:hypothetical protein